MNMRKTFTMTLNSDLMREAKKRAIDLGVPLYQFVEEAVGTALGDDFPIPSEGRKASESPQQGKAGR